VLCKPFIQTLSHACRKKPNLIVHLDVTPEESLRRINMRKRDCEAGIPLEYLKARARVYVCIEICVCYMFIFFTSFPPISARSRQQKLHAAYEEFLEEISRIIPVIRVNYAKFQNMSEMAEMVMR
jgi:deoxyadenosine kinase